MRSSDQTSLPASRKPAARASAASPARAFIIFDVVATVVLALALMLVFSAASAQLARARRDSDARRTLQLAVELELNRLRAGLVALPAESGAAATKQVGAITLETTARPGTGAWSGMTHVCVTARRQVQGYWARVELRACLPNLEAEP